MPFVNAYLTEEEKAIFDEAKIPDPRWNLPKYCLKTNKWTIDKEQSFALICCGVADRDEYEKETFALFYKKLDNEHMISLTLIHKHIKNETEKILRNEYNVNLVTKWIIHDWSKPKTLNITNQELLDILTDALSAYGVDGWPDVEYSVKAFVEFE